MAGTGSDVGLYEVGNGELYAVWGLWCSLPLATGTEALGAVDALEAARLPREEAEPP
jgi:hypothetical protein